MTTPATLLLQASDLHWMGDASSDYCLHGALHLQVGNITLLHPSQGSWTLSAAGLHLLRSLGRDHSRQQPLAPYNELIPCCGFDLLSFADQPCIDIQGCGGGVEIWIRHLADALIELTVADQQILIARADWHSAVLTLAAQIRQYYLDSPDKLPLDSDEASLWLRFWQEWDELVTKHSASAPVNHHDAQHHQHTPTDK
ncbi:hypothetical protein [Pokkaliibacter plantistimulans]|uniref:hypothetical protein n=1 Tax=Pokkaliibacter plantistimulans TaxID=1635171 RepID=UPI000D74AE70|nr:hypothetical protein [Pokkaliibacter plantistimulans]